jgi:hypothetical protein
MLVAGKKPNGISRFISLARVKHPIQDHVTSSQRFWCAIFIGFLLCLADRMANAQTSNSVGVFIVDMSAQVNARTFVSGAEVDVRGTFNGWGTHELINFSVGGNSNLYTGEITDTVDVNGGSVYYKYFAPSIGTGWESTYNTLNRAARLPATSGDSVVLPTVFFDDAGPLVTNAITFSVNMAEQINLGLFVPGTDTVSVRGDLNSYNLGDVLTHDPFIMTTNSSGVVASNVYAGTFTNVSPVNANESYKFWNSDSESEQWEIVAPENQDGSPTGNRHYINGGGNQALALVDFNDTSLQIAASNTVILEVSGRANIFGAGLTALPLGTGGGILPPLFHFQSGPNQVLVFTSVAGLISIGTAPNGYEFGYNGPDGIVNSPYNDSWTAVGGLSGYVDNNRIATLVGVFLDDSEPTNPPPSSLNFSDDDPIGHSFSSLAPQIAQVFFIGDGLTGAASGSQQVFIVPPTASRLVLGIPDDNYNDNSGSFVATFAISPLPQAPVPGIASGGFTTNGTIQLQLSGLAGWSYILQASTNLSNWISLGTNVPVATPFDMSDASATILSCRFYRTIQRP